MKPIIYATNQSTKDTDRKRNAVLSFLILSALIYFLTGCSGLSSQSVEESGEEVSDEKTEMIENEIESWESCESLRPASDEQIKCRTRIPEREFMEAWGTIIDPIILDGKYHYTFELLGIEMIVDYPFSEHIYVMETELPGNSGVEGMIYAYENTKEDVFWESSLWLSLKAAELVERKNEEDSRLEIPVVKLNEETYLITTHSLSYGGTDNMWKLLEENLVTDNKLDEFLKHVEFRLIK